MKLVTCKFCSRNFLPKNTSLSPKFCNKRCYMSFIKAPAADIQKVEQVVIEKQQRMSWSLPFMITLAVITVGIYIVSKVLLC